MYNFFIWLPISKMFMLEDMEHMCIFFSQNHDMIEERVGQKGLRRERKKKDATFGCWQLVLPQSRIGLESHAIPLLLSQPSHRRYSSSPSHLFLPTTLSPTSPLPSTPPPPRCCPPLPPLSFSFSEGTQQCKSLSFFTSLSFLFVCFLASCIWL